MWRALCFLALFKATAGLIYPRVVSNGIDGPNYGFPLFLTPLIEKGMVDDARKMAKVPPLKGTIDSYSGFFTVNKQFNSNMFFWYFPAEKSPETAPVVLWLQGGPGASSLYGLFEEHGPFYVKPQRGLKLRDYYWSQVVNIIYVDNPVGTGFSFTGDPKGYSRDETDVGNNLYELLKQFFTLFPTLQKNDFFVTGESYAGKYVPAAAYTIHTKNPTAPVKINLKGIAIGNGLCDPPNMLVYSDYLYQLGLVDSNGRALIKVEEDKIRDLAAQRKYLEAFKVFDQLLNGDMTIYKTLFYNLTGFEFYFNYLHSKPQSLYGDFGEYLQKDLVRRSIHVGNLTFNDGKAVELNLVTDVMQSVSQWLEILLEKYRVLIYNGQLDIIVAYPLTLSFLQRLKWSGADEYKIAPRKPWMVGQDLAGYSKTVKGFTELLVRNAGHMVPGDQPLWGLDLISRFVNNKPFSGIQKEYHADKLK
uniref:Carboxypeptidase n=2 Tax=Lygus hesperus TaxID=30085 RepID=A0A146LT64_LYGHE